VSKKIHTIQSSDKKEFDKKVNLFLDLGFELHDNGYQVISKDNHTFHSQVLIIDTDNYLIDFHHDGQIKHICPLNKKGYRDGGYYEWDENGKEILYINYVDGVEHFERITNEDVYIETSYYDNEQKKDRNSYRDGEPHGNCTEWYENGQKKIERHYLDGMDHGYWTEWYDNGQKYVERVHKNNIEDGVWTWWRENGEKEEEMFFKKGVKTHSKLYREDGSITERTEDIGGIVIMKTFKENRPVKEETYQWGTLTHKKEWNEDGSVKEDWKSKNKVYRPPPPEDGIEF